MRDEKHHVISVSFFPFSVVTFAGAAIKPSGLRIIVIASAAANHRF
jgi:hypothetical protein